MPEEVPLHLRILCAISDAFIYGEEKGANIVFKDLTLDH
jgi:hypothetical protein